MKTASTLALLVLGLVVYLWLRNDKPSGPVIPETGGPTLQRGRDGTSHTDVKTQPGQTTVPDMPATDRMWIEEHSAGLVISQASDELSRYPRGTAEFRRRKIDLGETPPMYRHQLQAAGYPIMLGEEHDLQAFRIQLTSLSIKPQGFQWKAPLLVTYPKEYEAGSGLETSGGFVFKRNEMPLTKVGVIVPKASPNAGGSPDDSRWRIDIRVNDSMGDVDMRTKAKPQAFDSDLVVLMATHPDKIAATAPVVWFKFNEAGSVSLLDD